MRISRGTRWGAAVGVVSVLVLAVGLGFSPFVRARILAGSRKRGLQVTIDSVRPGWLAVRLGGVKVALVGVDGLEADFAQATLEVSPWLSVRELILSDGRVVANGNLDALRAAIEAWRAARASGGRGERVGLSLRAERTTLRWDDGVSFVSADGMDLTRDDAGMRARIASATLRRDALTLSAGAAVLEFDASNNLTRAQIGNAEVGWSPAARPATDATSAGSVAADLAPPPLPPPLRTARAKVHKPLPPVRDDAPSKDASAPLLPLPDLHLLRASAASLALLLAKRMPEGSVVGIDGLTLRLQRGTEDRLSLGPGPLKVERRASSLDMTFSTAAGAAGTPMSVHARVPSDDGDVEVSLSGGPVSLALLGLRAKALADADRSMLAGRGRVVLEGHGNSLTFDFELTFRGLAAEDPRLAAEVLRGLDFDVRARGVLSDKGELRLDDAEAAMGALRIQAHGGLEQAADHVALAVDFDLPVNGCDAVFGSIPTALLPTLRGAHLTGTLAAQGRLAFDTRVLDDLALDYTVEDRCRMVGVPADLEPERFTKPFVHRIYTPDGKLAEEMTGPETDNWTSLDHISPFMQAAVLTTEDGAFFHHHGFNHLAIRNALLADLKARRFIRGASTITMQLAKNLFLSRDKTLSRKLEELILADYLEQAFTKDEMMELYLNVIEFGPSVYGITAAAEHYFGRPADQLDLAECMFLSSILPKPVRYHYLYEHGELPDSWLRGIRARMTIAQRTGKITEAELAEGLAEPVVFHMPNTPFPPPRPVATAARSEEGAPEWKELN